MSLGFFGQKKTIFSSKNREIKRKPITNKKICIFRATNINVKSQTQARKFSIYKQDSEIYSQNTSHG